MGIANDEGIRNRCTGFTLIELTIVITIIGILIGALAQGMTLYVIKSQQIKLDQSIGTVQRALRDFIAADDGTGTGTNNGRYPCPASLTAKPYDSDYGMEKRGSVTGTCQADPDISVYGVTWAPGSAFDARGSQKVYIGAVPTATMSIGREAMLDPWKSRLTYAVSATLTTNGRPLWGQIRQVPLRLNKMVVQPQQKRILSLFPMGWTVRGLTRRTVF